MQRQDLERMTREQLIAQAERLSIPRPRVLTAPELIDEIIGRTTKNDRERAKARGWLGRARDLLASVVERGLHLPEAARVLRKDADEKGWPAPPPPLPTVTLAEIYAAQGHLERALAVLDEVIAREPDHREARAMRARFAEQAHRSRARSGKDEAPPPDEQAAPKTTKAISAPPPAPPATMGETPPQAIMAAEEAPRPPAAATTESDTDTDEGPATALSAGLHMEAAMASPEEAAPETALADTQAAPELEAQMRAPEAQASAPGAQTGVLESQASVPEAQTSAPEAQASAPEAQASAGSEAEPMAAPEPGVELVVEPAQAAAAVPGRVAATEAGAAADLEGAHTEPAPALAAAMLPDEPSLPDRYDVDEIVAIAVDPRTLYFYWEVRPTTLAHARAQRPDGWLCVRLASVTATWEGPLVDTRDLHVDGLHGDRFVRDVQPGANLRVTIGWSSAAGFEPFAVGSEVTAPRAVPVETVAQEVARWESEPVVAPFQNPRVEPLHVAPAAPRGARAPGPMPRHVSPFVSPSAHIDQAWSHARGHGAHGAPVDTGVAHWGPIEIAAPVEGTPPREEEYEDEAILEDAPGWLEGPGGSSELGLRGPARRVRRVRRRRLLPGAPGQPGVFGWPPGGPVGLALGGASELSQGGASELSR